MPQISPDLYYFQVTPEQQIVKQHAGLKKRRSFQEDIIRGNEMHLQT